MASKRIETYKVDQFVKFKELNYFYHFTYEKKLNTNRHKHDFYEIIVVIKGALTQLFNNQPQTIHEGELSFISPKDSHKCISEEANTNIFNLCVTKEKFETLSNAMQIKPKFGTIYKFDVSSFETILNETNINQYPVEFFNVIMANILSTALESKTIPAQKNFSKKHRIFLEKLDLDNNLSLSIDEMAKKTGYSRIQFIRIIKKLFNKNPNELILEKKIAIAKNLLLHTDLSISEISIKSCFNFESRFFDNFKKITGYTPLDYRKYRASASK